MRRSPFSATSLQTGAWSFELDSAAQKGKWCAHGSAMFSPSLFSATWSTNDLHALPSLHRHRLFVFEDALFTLPEGFAQVYTRDAHTADALGFCEAEGDSADGARVALHRSSPGSSWYMVGTASPCSSAWSGELIPLTTELLASMNIPVDLPVAPAPTPVAPSTPQRRQQDPTPAPTRREAPIALCQYASTPVPGTSSASIWDAAAALFSQLSFDPPACSARPSDTSASAPPSSMACTGPSCGVGRGLPEGQEEGFLGQACSAAGGSGHPRPSVSSVP